ncbi:hypothetical protein [Nocardia brasiliensis]
MTEVLVGVALHDTVLAALREAWTQARPHPVDTRDLLVALMRADTSTATSDYGHDHECRPVNGLGDRGSLIGVR